MSTKKLGLLIVVTFVSVTMITLLGFWAGIKTKDDNDFCQSIATARGFTVLDRYPYCILADAQGQMYGFKK